MRDDYPDDEIPPWCRLPLAAHHDGMGGCWSISHGCVAEQGEPGCRWCQFYGGDKPALAPVAAGGGSDG